MDRILELVLLVVAPLALSLFACHKNLLTKGGTVVAFILAEIIGYCADLWWDLAFFLFPVIAFLATKWRLKDKIALGLQEGKTGERGIRNILGVGLIPTIIAIIFFFRPSDLLAIAFISALAVSTSDTVASETGMWAKKTYMITTLRQIEPGPNGGVSVYGFVAAMIGTMIFSLISCLFVYGDVGLTGISNFVFIIPFVAGMVGNVVDSVFGALLENKGFIDKYINNCSTSLIGAVIGSLLFIIL